MLRLFLEPFYTITDIDLDFKMRKLLETKSDL